MATQFSEGPAATGHPTFWERARRGWPARYPLVQLPNIPMTVLLAALVVAVSVTGSVRDYAWATFFVALSAWAWLELTSGATWPRRVLGAAALVFAVVTIGEALANV